MAKPKQHKCRECGSYYQKFQSTQKVCSLKCAMAMGKRTAAAKREKLAKSDRLQERKRLKALKEKVKSRSQWLREAQAIFNKFIRLRDRGQPCISCGRWANKWDAGHYKTVGANPELRFHEDNVHRQCVPCNQHQHGNIVNYRLGLIERIGLEKVEWLERKDHAPQKLTVDEIKALIKVYKAKVKELERENQYP